MSGAEEYLTMTRIMTAEWEKWQKYNSVFRGMNGLEKHLTEGAYKAGFMAGFAYRFTGEQND